MNAILALNRYKSVQVKTASPSDVLLMLYDGIFKFLEEAKVAMAADDRARSGDRINRAHAILSELAATLNREHAPELCDNLAAIYVFSMSRLVEANLHRDVARVDDVIRIMTPIREAFRVAASAGSQP